MTSVRGPETSKKVGGAGGTKPIRDGAPTRQADAPPAPPAAAAAPPAAPDSPRTHDATARLQAYAAAQEPAAPATRPTPGPAPAPSAAPSPSPVPSPAPPPSPAPAPTKAQDGDGGFLGSAWNAVKKGAGAVKNTVVSGAKAVGKVVVGGTKAVVKVASSGVKAVVKVASSGVKAVVKVASSGAKAVSGAFTTVKDYVTGNTVKRKPGDMKSRRIERDPVDSNTSNATTQKAAKDSLSATKATADKRYGALSTADKARYDRAKAAVKGDVEGEAALQKLLADGKLPGGAARGGDKATLLAQIDTLATQKLAGGIDRRALVADTIQEIADPASINQHSRNTCVPTTASIVLAKSDPAEYARLVAGLAAPEGKVKTARGDTLTRETDFNAADGNRSISGRLLQPAFMEFANGSANYDNTKDKHSNGRTGLNADEAERLLDSVTGRDYTTIGLDSETVSKTKLDDAYNKMKKSLDAGKPVPVGLYFQTGGHKLLATKVENGRVYYTNPWGKEESLTIEEFKQRLKNVNLPNF